MFRILASVTISFSLLAAFDSQIASAEALDHSADMASIKAELDIISEGAVKYEGGLIKNIISAREQILKLSFDALNFLELSKSNQITTEYTIELAAPDPERAANLLVEIQGQMEIVSQAEKEVSKSGGLLQALALSRVETEKLTLSQLRLGYYQALYGLPLATDMSSSNQTVENDTINADSLETSEPTTTKSEVSEPPSNWIFSKTTDDFTDKETSYVILLPSGSISRDAPEALIVRCDGKGGYDILVKTNGYIGARNNSVPVRYRFGNEAAVSERWSESTTGTAAFLPNNYTDFRKRIATGDDFVFEITDFQGSSASSNFDNNIDEKLNYVMRGCK
jgi:hypothetical protein